MRCMLRNQKLLFCGVQVKEQKEEAQRFKKKLQELEDMRTESFLVQIFHINKARLR